MSISESAMRDRNHKPVLALVKKAKAVRCQSKHYRKFPHSFYSGASFGKIRKNLMNNIRSHICTKTFGLISYFPYLSLREWEFLFTKLTVCCFFVFQPNQSLVGRKSVNTDVQIGNTKNYMWKQFQPRTFYRNIYKWRIKNEYFFLWKINTERVVD